jgi:hypothetical protein
MPLSFIPTDPNYNYVSNIASDNQTLEGLKFDFGKDLDSFNSTYCKFENVVFSE